MARKEVLSPQDLKAIFPLDDHDYMLTWLRDKCHQWRRGNSYFPRVVKMLVDKGFTVAPNYIRGQNLRYEDPSFQIKIDGTVKPQPKGPYFFTYIGVWAQEAGYTIHREFMYDKDGNKYMCLAWKAYPTRIEVMTNKGLMFADPNGVLRASL